MSILANTAEKPHAQPRVHRCQACGCTDDHACAGGCFWVLPDVCSRCALQQLVRASYESAPLQYAHGLMAELSARSVRIMLESLVRLARGLDDGERSDIYDALVEAIDRMYASEPAQVAPASPLLTPPLDLWLPGDPI